MNSVGIDASPQQVAVAQRFNVTGVTQSEWRPYLDGKASQYEFVLIDNVIEHLHKDEIMELLQKVYEALAPGGTIYLSTPNAGSVFGAPLAFGDFTHEGFFTAASLRQVLAVCGFTGLKVFGEPVIGCDVRSNLRKASFNIIKPFIKIVYLVGTGGGGRTRIPHIIEPSLGAVGMKTKEPLQLA